MDQKKHILLISYVFPPYYGIGGRRWAKHAIELAKLGYTVHVICARNPYSKESLWWDQVKHHANIKRYELNSRYPAVLLSSPQTLVAKLRYKIWSLFFALFTKGSPYERTAFWKGPMLRKARQLIHDHQIRQVICTGGPFAVMYHATLLKQWKPELLLLNDLRDPWTWGPNWGFPSLSPGRMQEEKKRERATIKGSDIFTVPNQVMYDYLAEHYPDLKQKLQILPHFFDPSEIPVKPKSTSPKVRMLLYGTIYEHVEHYIEKSAAFLGKHTDRFTLDIYTDNRKHEATYKKYGALNVTFHQPIPAHELFQRFEHVDFVLIYTPAYGKDNISTKFFEIIHSRTPVLFFSEAGLAADFMEKNRIGIHLTPENFEEKLLGLAKDKASFGYNRNFDISEYSLEKIGVKISNLLENTVVL